MILLLALATAAAEPADGYEDIVVEGLRDPFRLTPAQLREAVDAYNANRAALAPDAPLRFQIFMYRTDPSLADVRVRLLADDGEAVPLALDADGRFALPPLDYAKRRFALQANRKNGSLRIRAYILSPESRDEDRSLGEARLLCKIQWAMIRPTISIFLRGIIGAAGGPCDSARIGVYLTLERPLARADVIYGTLSKPVAVRADGFAFRYPGYDKSLPNEARLKLEYR